MRNLYLHIKLAFIFLVGCINAHAADDNTLVLSSFTSQPGEVSTLAVSMNNSADITGFQFDIVIPDGLSIEKDAYGEEVITLSEARTSANRHMLSVAQLANGATRVVGTSLKNYLFSGNSGEIVIIKIKVASDTRLGTYRIVLKNIELSTPRMEMYKPYAVSCECTVTGGTSSTGVYGDVNGDGQTSISDISEIVKTLLNNGTTELPDTDPSPDFSVYEDWVSTNTTDGSTSSHTYIIEHGVGDTLEFDWSVSSELGHDYLIINLDDSDILKKSGNDGGHYSKSFTTSGTSVLTAKYDKDSSQSSGDDMCRIYNIVLNPGSSDGDSTDEGNDNKDEDNIGSHEYVDLGLPSGTLWATCNVGADNPEDYGDYFAWGEVEPKSIYDESTYKWRNDYSYTKYFNDSSEGNIYELELEDDAAYMNWGADWRMPTYVQQEELLDSNNCFWEWTSINGKNGYLVTSKINGSSIFLPAAGYHDDSLKDSGSKGYYSTRSQCFSWCIFFLNYKSNNTTVAISSRELGYSVRPVRSSISK